YTLTESIKLTGCSASNTVVVTVNLLPTPNAGSDQTICLGSSASIGAGSTSGHTYSWSSNPSGFTSTSSGVSVSPTTTTTYYLTEKITSTSCTKSDSVVVTVNPLPSASTGPDSTICKGGAFTIGVSAVSGNTYSWTSSPGGFTSTTSNPSVSPSVSTTYFLTE